MIVATTRVKAETPEALESLMKAFASRSRLVDRAEGFLGMEVWVNRESLEAVIVTWWVDRESFERWVRSEEFKEAHSRPVPRADEMKVSLTLYEVVERAGAASRAGSPAAQRPS